MCVGQHLPTPPVRLAALTRFFLLGAQAVSKANKTLEREAARISAARDLASTTETQTDPDALLIASQAETEAARTALEESSRNLEQNSAAAAEQREAAQREAAQLQVRVGPVLSKPSTAF